MLERKALHQAETKKLGIFYGWLIALASFATIVVAWGTYYTFGIFFEPVLKEFGWTRAMTSGAFSLCGVLNGFLGIIMGRLTDRFGPRLVVVVCGISLGLGYLLMSCINNIWQLYLVYGVIIAIGMGAAYVPLVSTVTRWFVKRRGLVTGIVISGMGVGMMTIAPAASQLIHAYGWRMAYVVVGIVAMLFIILAAQFLRRDPTQLGLLPYGLDGVDTEGPNIETKGFSLAEAFHTKQFWVVLAMFLCLLFCLQAVMVHVVIDAIGLGVPAFNAANIISIIGGSSIAGRIVMGGAADKMGNKNAFLIGFIGQSIALTVLVVAHEMWMLSLFGVIFGFSSGSLSTVFSPVVAQLFGLTSHGVIMGTVLFGGTVGGAIGPFVVGRIFDMTGSYQIGFLVCACTSAIGIILASFLRPTIS